MPFGAHEGVSVVGVREVGSCMCFIFLTHVTLSCIFTAQVPDDEQFVPDFQSDSCKYLISLVNLNCESVSAPSAKSVTASLIQTQ